jgi:hypothetical protein
VVERRYGLFQSCHSKVKAPKLTFAALAKLISRKIQVLLNHGEWYTE